MLKCTDTKCHFGQMLKCAETKLNVIYFHTMQSIDKLNVLSNAQNAECLNAQIHERETLKCTASRIPNACTNKCEAQMHKCQMLKFSNAKCQSQTIPMSSVCLFAFASARCPAFAQGIGRPDGIRQCCECFAKVTVEIKGVR